MLPRNLIWQTPISPIVRSLLLCNLCKVVLFLTAPRNLSVAENVSCLKTGTISYFYQCLDRWSATVKLCLSKDFKIQLCFVVVLSSFVCLPLLISHSIRLEGRCTSLEVKINPFCNIIWSLIRVVCRITSQCGNVTDISMDYLEVAGLLIQMCHRNATNSFSYIFFFFFLLLFLFFLFFCFLKDL